MPIYIILINKKTLKKVLFGYDGCNQIITKFIENNPSD